MILARKVCERSIAFYSEIYDWAGEYRLINIEKREILLGGRSVWYSNDESIPADLTSVFHEIHLKDWRRMTQEVSICMRTHTSLSEDLACESISRGQHPIRRHDVDLLRRASRLLYGSGIDGRQRRLRSQFVCHGVAQ